MLSADLAEYTVMRHPNHALIQALLHLLRSLLRCCWATQLLLLGPKRHRDHHCWSASPGALMSSLLPPCALHYRLFYCRIKEVRPGMEFFDHGAWMEL